MAQYIGLDVHCKETAYCVQDASGTILSEGKVPTNLEGFQKLLARVKTPAGTPIGLESGTQAFWVSRLFTELDMEPKVIDAYEVRRKARRLGQKCDRRDAFELCDGLRRDQFLSIVYVPQKAVLRLRQVLSRRRHFVRQCTSQINAAKYLLRAVGLQGEAKHLKTWPAWQGLLARPRVASLKTFLRRHARLWQVARSQVEALEKELEGALNPFKETSRRLQTLPGVGRLVSATFIAVLGDPERFPDSGQVISYAGLAPSTYDSADTVRRGHITKRGSAELRGMLVEAAQNATKETHPLHPYFVRITAVQGYKRAVVAVAQRMARILYRMWRDGQDFDLSKLNVIREHTKKTRVVFYRIRPTHKQKANV
jgi:transposase